MSNPVIPPDETLSFTLQNLICPTDGLVAMQVYADFSIWCPVHNGYLRPEQVSNFLSVVDE